MNKKRVILAGLFILILAVSVSLKTTRNKVKSMTFEDNVFVIKKRLKSRGPSSILKSVIEKEKTSKTQEGPLFNVADREKFLTDKSFLNEEEEIVPTSPEVPLILGAQRTTQNAPSPLMAQKEIQRPPLTGGPTKTNMTFGNVNPPPLPGTSEKNTNTTNSNGPSSDNSPPGQVSHEHPSSICSSNLGGGSFNGPISVELTCTHTSTIKYCLSEGTCCDPETGSTYSGPISIGQPSKTFCLSYTGGSDVSEAIYSFNADLPHLDILQKKLEIQTTQLETQMAIMSNNFGSNDHSVGLINFRQSNPQTMNLNCQEAVEYVPSGWAGSGNLVVLPETPVFPYTPMEQLNVMFNLTKLIYGENHLVSYIKSSQYVEDEFACIHSKMILRDFDFFESLPVEVSDANEFTGGFSPIGPGEDNVALYRGPASDINPHSFEELRSGLLSIFFDK